VEAGLANAPSTSAQREALLDFGAQFGIAYQMTDDYLDHETEDYDQVAAQIDCARASLEPLGRSAAHLEDMLDYLNAKVWETSRSHR
jgi:hypothetical protein